MPRTKTIQELKKEIQAKEARLARLTVRRSKAAAAIDAIDRQIAAITGSSSAPKSAPKSTPKSPARKTAGKAKRRGPRPTGKTLNDYIAKVLASSTGGQRAKDIMTAVGKAGYKTKSKDFYGIVAAALRDKKRFQKISRGVYKNK